MILKKYINMKRKLLLFIFILLFSKISEAKVIDRYGFRIGGGYSNNITMRKGQFGDIIINIWNYPKLSPCFYFNAEKKLTNFLFIRSEIGYIQKGFIDDYFINLPDGNKLKIEDDKVMLDDLSFDLAFKVEPFAKNYWPYFILGFRGDYLLKNRSAQVKYNETMYQQYKYEVDHINKFTISGLLGVGFKFQDFMYFEFEYNPSIFYNYIDSESFIIDRYIGVSLGINIDGIN